MTDQTEQQNRPPTPEEDIRDLYSRVAKLNDAMSALLDPEWGAQAGILPDLHPLHPARQAMPLQALAGDQEQAAPVDWEAVVKRRERELKQVGEARHRAEQQRDRYAALVRDFVDTDSCRSDHHGHCQTHGWTTINPSCPHYRARQALAALDQPKEAP